MAALIPRPVDSQQVFVKFVFQKLQLYKNFSQRFCHFIWWILQSPFLLIEEDSSDIWKLKPLEVLAANPAVSFHSSRINRLEFRESGVLCRYGQPPGAAFCRLLESRHWVLDVWGGSSMTSQAWDMTAGLEVMEEGVTGAGNATERDKESPSSSDPPALFCFCKLHPLLPSNFPILHPKPTIWWALNYQCLFSWVKALKLLLLAWKRRHPTVSTICWNTFTFSPSLFFFNPLGWKLADNNLVTCHVPLQNVLLADRYSWTNPSL